MAHKNRTPKAARGRGTKPERKAQRRAVAQAGQGPVTPARSDYAGKDAAKRRLGPRRLGPHTIDAPGGKSPSLPGSRPRGLGRPANPKGNRGPQR
jgi:hypothetical protein